MSNLAPLQKGDHYELVTGETGNTEIDSLAELSSIKKVVKSAWTTARAGRRIDLLNPTVDMIHEDDVAAGLARKIRYNGWLDGPIEDTSFTVAQHSVYVSRTMKNYILNCGADRETAKRYGLIGLIHDGPEYAINDVITPLKEVLPDYQALEKVWEPVMYEWAGCANPTADEMAVMHWADRMVLLQEMLEFGRSIQWAIDQGWDQPVVPLFDANPGHYVWTPKTAYDLFLDELHYLQKY